MKKILKKVTLSGWLTSKKRSWKFIIYRSKRSLWITQCVIENNNKFFNFRKIKPESVLKITGKVVKRAKGTENIDLKLENRNSIKNLEILSDAKELPIPVFGEQDYPEDIRLNIDF